MIKRKEMPQRPVEKSIRAQGIWDFDELRREHGLRANYYDGVSHVVSRRKYAAYAAWCESTGQPVRLYDGGWWAGWKEYTEAHPGWHDADWKAADQEATNLWRRENGYETDCAEQTQ